MDIQAVARRILDQRLRRYTDTGPDLSPFGSARFRRDGIHLRVAYAVAHPGMAGPLVDRVLRYARLRGMRVQWVVVPQRPGESELPPAMLAARFRLYERLLLMAHKGPITAQVNPLVVVEPITRWDEMVAYEDGNRQAFFDEMGSAVGEVAMRARQRWQEQERGWCQYYVASLGSLGNGAIGGCYVTLFEEIPTIMGVYTLAAARRRGVATALLARVIADTLPLKRPLHFVTMPSPGVAPAPPERDLCCLFVKDGNPAERLYHQLGFVPLVDELTFDWELS
ncbi:MAG: hypothetical protein ABI068_16865 [Ktedonobacterales bacterium]